MVSRRIGHIFQWKSVENETVIQKYDIMALYFERELLATVMHFSLEFTPFFFFSFKLFYTISIITAFQILRTSRELSIGRGPHVSLNIQLRETFFFPHKPILHNISYTF